jgi:hypothetical protein
MVLEISGIFLARQSYFRTVLIYIWWGIEKLHEEWTACKSLVGSSCTTHSTVPIWPRRTSTTLGQWRRILWAADWNQIMRYLEQEGNNTKQRAYSPSKMASTNWFKVKMKLSLCLINWTPHHEDSPYVVSGQYAVGRRPGGPHSRYGRCGVKKNPLPLPGIKLRPSSQ